MVDTFNILDTPSGGGGIAFDGALVDKSANQGFTNAVAANFTWDQEVYDLNSFHDNVTNNDRLTIPAGVTRARVILNVRMAILAASNTHRFEYRLYHNDGVNNLIAVESEANDGTAASYQPAISMISPVITVAEGDYFFAEFLGNQASGNPAAVNGDQTNFSIQVLE